MGDGDGPGEQPVGKIVVAGTVQRTSSSDTDFGLVRLLPDGSLDPTFGLRTVAFDLGPAGARLDTAADVAVTPGGKVFVAGSAAVADGSLDFAVAVLNPDGTPDTTFSGDGRLTVAFDVGGNKTDQAAAVAVQADGSSVVAGTVTRNANQATDFGLIRLDADGALDAVVGRRTVAFDPDGAGAGSATGAGLAIQPDRRIVLVGGGPGGRRATSTSPSPACSATTPPGRGRRRVRRPVRHARHARCARQRRGAGRRRGDRFHRHRAGERHGHGRGRRGRHLTGPDTTSESA